MGAIAKLAGTAHDLVAQEPPQVAYEAQAQARATAQLQAQAQAAAQTPAQAQAEYEHNATRAFGAPWTQ